MIIVFDYVSNNPSTLEISDLVRAGLQNVDSELLEEYRTNLSQYTTDLGKGIDRANVQLVIDVTNSVALASSSKQLTNVNKAIKLIEDLQNGELNTRLLSEMNS